MSFEDYLNSPAQMERMKSGRFYLEDALLLAEYGAEHPEEADALWRDLVLFHHLYQQFAYADQMYQPGTPRLKELLRGREATPEAVKECKEQGTREFATSADLWFLDNGVLGGWKVGTDETSIGFERQAVCEATGAAPAAQEGD